MAAGIPVSYPAQVRQASKVKFGDYQANGVMAIAKQLGIPARKLAEKVVSLLQLDGIARKVEITDPGFINIIIDPQWLATQITNALSSPRLGILPVATAQTIVVDYSAPNVAKEMHVGHVRSTLIGDASARTLEFIGHKVIRANHIGDWGTQFGILIAYLTEKVQYGIANLENIQISQLEHYYCAAKKHYDKDPAFAECARSYVVKLQEGDDSCRKIWRKLVQTTLVQNQKIYDRLNVSLSQDNIMGESLYNDMLPGIVADLKAKGLAVESEGATVVVLDEFKNKDGQPIKVIIKKRDGAYLYTTTDIACAKYRYEILKADRVIYYIDSRQHQHLMQVWTIVRKAGYVPESVSLEHHMFGTILGDDGKPFKTRSGGTVKIADLLDEALERASNLIAQKNPDMKAAERERLANVVGIGAVKYAELSKHRTTDYRFNWNQMLSFEGNTAPYIQYAYTRVVSLFQRGGEEEIPLIGKSNICLSTKQETKLAVRLLQYEETITTIASDGTPHLLCAYLYDIAVLFSSFYEKCPILNADSDALRKSRLQLALLTSRTLKHGLYLLGIDTVRKM